MPLLVDRDLVISHAHIRDAQKKKLFLNALHEERISFLSIARHSKRACLSLRGGEAGRGGARLLVLAKARIHLALIR